MNEIEKTSAPQSDKYIANLKRKIMDIYIEYRSDLSSKPPIKKLARSFAILIDCDRPEDYYVRGIDFENLSISIVDKKTDTIYAAKFTRDSHLRSPIEAKELCLEVTSFKDNVQIQELYVVLNGEEPDFELRMSELIITHGDRAIVFNKLHTYNWQGYYPFAISLEESRPTYDDLRNRQPLYKKTHSSSRSIAHGGLKEEIYDPQKGENHWLRMNTPNIADISYSIFRESESVKLFGCIRDIDKKYYTKKSPQNHLIHLVDLHGDLFINGIDVYEDNDGLQIHYHLNQERFHFFIRKAKSGVLQPKEIDKMIAYLQAAHGESEFIRAVILTLQEYNRRLKIHRGLASPPENLLTLEYFCTLSFDEISRVILEDIDAYFDNINDTYEKINMRLNGSFASSPYVIKPTE